MFQCFIFFSKVESVTIIIIFEIDLSVKAMCVKMICFAVKVTKFVIYAKSILRHFAVRFVNITKGSLKRTDVRSIK